LCTPDWRQQPPPKPTLFPYTTLFRSDVVGEADALEWTARGGPGSRHHRLPGAGHLFHHVPDDMLTDLVRAVAATPTGPDAFAGADAFAGPDALDADRGSAGAVA